MKVEYPNFCWLKQQGFPGYWKAVQAREEIREEWYDEVSTWGGNDNKLFVGALLYLTFPQPLIKTCVEFEISKQVMQEKCGEYNAAI